MCRVEAIKVVFVVDVDDVECFLIIGTNMWSRKGVRQIGAVNYVGFMAIIIIILSYLKFL